MAFITAETRSDLIELSVAMLKQAPSAALLEELIALSVGGGSLADAADHIADTAAFKAEYPSFQTAGQYAAEIFDNITTGGTVTADIRTAVIELATGMLTSGSVTKSGLALAIAEYLAAPAALLNADFADIAQSFQNRADAAEYFVVTKELGGSTAAELAAAIASVTSAAATLTAANTAADATASAEAVVAGQTFTLTNSTDINSAVSFYAPRVYTPGGNDRVNSIQDEDSLTGTGDSASLNAILGEPNDAAGAVITPELNNIKTVDVTFAASNTAMTLNLQDSTGVETVNVSRISGGTIATVDDMLATTTALSVSNTNAQGTAHLLYQDSQLDGAQAVTVTLDDADLATLLVGSTATTPTEGIETLTIVASGALSTVTSFDNLADNVGATNQNVAIQAAVDLTITGFTDDGEISAITVSGAGDVTLGETGSRAVATQESTVDASGLTGSLTVDYQNLDGDLDSSVTGGSGDDVIENRDTTTTSWAGDILADVAGGAGDDTIHVDGDLSKPTERDADDGDVLVDGGAGDDTIVVAGDVSENAAVTGGAGDDTINIGGTINALSGTAAASATDGDVQGTVDAGAGDDTINITHYEVGANAYESAAATITGVAGGLDGGEGTDVLNYHSNSNATTVATSSALTAARITGIETINLVSKQSLDTTDAATINAVQASLVTANDADTITADFTFDLGEASGATTINMVNEAVVIAATSTGSVTTYNPGDAATYTLTNVSAAHALSVSADEGVTGNARGTMISATAYATAVATDVAADATLNLTLAATASQTTVANAARNDALTVTLNGTGDFAINDGGTGTTTSNDIDSLTLVVNGAAARTIALGADDFNTALTLTGTQSGALKVTSVEAVTINASAIAGNTTITLASLTTDDDKVITMGAGDDSVVGSAVTIDRDDTIDFGDGTDSLTVAALASAGDLTNSNDEYFENMTSLETLNLTAGADVVLDDDAQAAGISTVNVSGTTQSSTVSVQSDYSNALAMTLASSNTLVLDNDANVATTIVVATLAADTTITGTDFGTGGSAITVTAAATATNVVASAATGLDLIITATAGDVTSITVNDSAATASATGAITITTDAAWAGAGDTLIVDASGIDDDDNTAGTIVDDQTVAFNASAATAGDYAVDFRGSAMVDTVTGTAQADTITLGAGADVYNSTAGADTITGGTGADDYIYATIANSTGGTVDSITDWDTASDEITFTIAGTASKELDFSNFANNRASLADGLSTLDGNAGDFFFATSGSIAIDVNGDGNISDGIDYVVDIAGEAVAAGDVNFDITAVITSARVEGGAGNDIIRLTAANTTDTTIVDLTSVTAASAADTVYGFITTDDEIALINTAGITAGTDAGALVAVSGIAALTIDDVIADTAANLGAAAVTVGDQSAVFTSGGYAFETDTGKLYYDADGDFTAGVVLVGTIYSGDSGTAATMVAGDFQFGV